MNAPPCIGIFLRTFTFQIGCLNMAWKGDGVCDDGNNVKEW